MMLLKLDQFLTRNSSFNCKNFWTKLCFMTQCATGRWHFLKCKAQWEVVLTNDRKKFEKIQKQMINLFFKVSVCLPSCLLTNNSLDVTASALSIGLKKQVFLDENSWKNKKVDRSEPLSCQTAFFYTLLEHGHNTKCNDFDLVPFFKSKFVSDLSCLFKTRDVGI